MVSSRSSRSSASTSARVADVAVHEAEFGACCGRREVREIPGIGQRVEHHHPIAGVMAQPVVHEIRADEAGAAGDQQVALMSP